MYRLTLRSFGNPDYGQNPDKPMSPTETVEVPTLEAASRAASEYRDRHMLGGGNWPRTEVFDGNVPVAVISYNGRVWDYDDYIARWGY